MTEYPTLDSVCCPLLMLSVVTYTVVVIEIPVLNDVSTSQPALEQSAFKCLLWPRNFSSFTLN